MRRNPCRRAGALAIAVILGAGAALVSAAPAAAAKRYAAGTYTATFPNTATSSALVVTNAPSSTSSGTFELTDFGDYGVWIARGMTVAFLVSSSSVGDQGAVLIAKLTTTGLDPGEIDEPGAAEQPWSAVRIGEGASPSTGSASSRVTAARSMSAPTTYDAVFDGTTTDTLTMVRNHRTTKSGIFGLTNLHDLGVWAKLGKQIVLGITNGDDAGIVLVGTQTAEAIGTPDAPSLYFQQDSGVHPWYATRSG